MSARYLCCFAEIPSGITADLTSPQYPGQNPPHPRGEALRQPFEETQR